MGEKEKAVMIHVLGYARSAVVLNLTAPLEPGRSY